MRWQTHEAVLAHEADFDGFRRAARQHLALGVAPQDLAFSIGAGHAPGSADTPSTPDAGPPPSKPSMPSLSAAPAPPPAQAAVRIAAASLTLLQQAALHADPARFELMYRWLWQLRDQPALQLDPLHPDRQRLETLAQAVRREQHKMKAFVRFRQVDEPDQATPLHVAWFEPDHHVLEAVAPFFVRRFAGMRFAILTPRRSLRWDGLALHWAAGARREQAPPPDDGEALWLAYYAHIFNPARLKLAAMLNEMPRRYWRNLPEAALIAPLAAAAAARTGQMLDSAGTQAQRRIPLAARAADAPGQAVRAQLPPALPVPLPDGEPARQSLLQQRRDLAAHCRACALGACATQTVPGQGTVGARLMLVGEQPGDQEDLRGQPFVGPAGQLLDSALRLLGLDREAIYLTNAVKHFKYALRGKRRIHKTASQREALACQPWLDEEIALVQPQAIVALGRTAARSLLGREVTVGEARGQWSARPDGTPVLVTLHPAALLRMDPALREAAEAAWRQDLVLARERVR